MIEITNRKKSPVQLILRSKTAPRAFTTLNVPGIGAKKNVIYISDEMMTEYVNRVEGMGLITTKQVSNKLSKGE